MKLTFENIEGGNEVYMDCLTALVGENRSSFLDIGCNHAPFTSQLGFKHREYIDMLPRELDNKDEQQFFHQENILQRKLHSTYNSTFALDVIEHLYKADGCEMLMIMKYISNRQILFTPLDEWMMTDDADKNPESHRSIWKPGDIDDRWIKLIFPKYHPTLGIGAWWFMHCENLEEEFERVKNELKTKSWYNGK